MKDGTGPHSAETVHAFPAVPLICLCMIVKNESHVITRCLDSVRPLIDTWVIVDTGSTDGTQQVIRDHLRDLPGELFERPWVDFAHNRSESLVLARRRADYVLIIDADEVLQLDPGFTLPALDADSYLFPIRSAGLTYYKTQLVRDALDWYFIGVVHEYVFAEQASVHKLMEGLQTLRIPDGARSRDPLTYRRDALLLEDALLREPENARYMFYLAQSYADAHEPALAIDRYLKRVVMGGWAEETWYSLYRIAVLKRQLNVAWPEVMSDYLAAYASYAGRAEPLFHVGFYYQALKQYSLAYLFFAQAMQVPFPKADLLYVERQVYDVLLPVEYSVACFYTGRHREAIETGNRLLADPDLEPELVEKVILNRSFSLEALYPKRPSEVARSSRVLVCIVIDGADSLSSSCIESLQMQNKEDFEVVLIENGISSGQHDTTLLGTKFVWKHSPEPLSTVGCLKLAEQQAYSDDILFLMHGTDRLLDGGSLDRVAGHFKDYDCALMYGQYNRADGARGDATPLACQEDLEAHKVREDQFVPLALRCSLLSETGLPEAATAFDLLRKAGFGRIRFNDQPLLIRTSGNFLKADLGGLLSGSLKRDRD